MCDDIESDEVAEALTQPWPFVVLDEPSEVPTDETVAWDTDFPSAGSIRACVKCGKAVYSGDSEESSARIEYHTALSRFDSDPCHRLYGWTRREEVGEHLCIKCRRCRYGWMERIKERD